MTSVSLEVWKMEPARSSRVRISAALTRLPLWAMASPPWGVLEQERLRVAELGAARSRVADVADGRASRQRGQRVLAETLRHQPHRDLAVELARLRGHDAG
jgi:hypothetical protein